MIVATLQAGVYFIECVQMGLNMFKLMQNLGFKYKNLRVTSNCQFNFTI